MAPAFGQGDIRIARRRGVPGASIRQTILIDPRDVEATIQELAATIGMRATLTPISTSEDGGEIK